MDPNPYSYSGLTLVHLANVTADEAPDRAASEDQSAASHSTTTAGDGVESRGGAESDDPLHSSFPQYDPSQPMPRELREKHLETIRAMFAHAYDSYIEHAYPEGDLKPISCR